MQTERAIPVVLLLIVLLGAVTVPLLAKKRSSKPKRELIVLTGGVIGLRSNAAKLSGLSVHGQALIPID